MGVVDMDKHVEFLWISKWSVYKILFRLSTCENVIKMWITIQLSTVVCTNVSPNVYQRQCWNMRKFWSLTSSWVFEILRLLCQVWIYWISDKLKYHVKPGHTQPNDSELDRTHIITYTCIFYSVVRMKDVMRFCSHLTLIALFFMCTEYEYTHLL